MLNVYNQPMNEPELDSSYIQIPNPLLSGPFPGGNGIC